MKYLLMRVCEGLGRKRPCLLGDAVAEITGVSLGKHGTTTLLLLIGGQMKSHSVEYVRGAVWAMLAWALCGVVGSAAAQAPLSGLQSGIGTLPLLGRGRYVGTFLAWTQMEKGWFGEGEIKFYMDGDRDFPTICGTGTEDYFPASFGFPKAYSTAYSGSTLPANENAQPPQSWSLYRWHIQDPINFQQDLRVTIQALGWEGTKYRKLAKDRIASVAYWYQDEPHAPFPQLPSLADAARLRHLA